MTQVDQGPMHNGSGHRDNFGVGNEQHIEVNNAASLEASNFDAARRTVFVVHGWIHDINEEWAQQLITQLLSQEDYNVIGVDWREGASKMYSQSTANARVVGAQIAQMLDWLGQEAEISNSKVHIIGHSLGAHIAGYAGERVDGLRRISGLDPVGPYFENTDPVVRLDPTDADFVDVIHTDMLPIYFLGLGIKMAVGHVDFYPNGGLNQPGCGNLFDTFWGTIWELITLDLLGALMAFSCNHVRSADFYTDSINAIDLCPYASYVCGSYDDYDDGLCSTCERELCSSMGYHSESYTRGRGSLYLSTGENPIGNVDLEPDSPVYIEFRIRPIKKLGVLIKMDLEFDDNSFNSWLFPDTWFVDKVIIREGLPEEVYTFCGHDQPAKSKKTITVYTC
ncbi:PREDICTED: inactive pancreatic lipase-related protein 1-like [Priapulus caudatus]|uniref:Inactive pancreatic lipase-related protein 1-like n=1 Tax=Priapulus caudatus TaxID=37621 RepID=A0ABM1EQ82_PRICU|nr:PREDICTED: inactive pancreatic lipase-related protein 1-like [Priapulus caudatus]